MRLITRLLKARVEYISVQEVVRQTYKPVKNIKQILVDKGIFWIMVPWIGVLSYLHYLNDVEMVGLVRYNVKLYKDKPKINPPCYWLYTRNK